MPDVRVNVNGKVDLDTSEAEDKARRLNEAFKNAQDGHDNGPARPGRLRIDQDDIAGRTSRNELSREFNGIAAAIRGARRGIMSLATSGGNLMGVGAGAAEDVAAMAMRSGGALGPVGLSLLAAGGAMMATNALSEQYEKAAPSGMKMSAMFGEVGGSTKQNNDSFASSIARASAAASAFGFKLEDGTAVLTAFAQAGLSRMDAMARTDNAFAYARAYGLNPAETVGYDAAGARFGQRGNLLGLAAGAAEASGLGPGQYKEFLDATLSIFEQGLGKGIVKGFADIDNTMSFFSQAGDTWKGKYGAEKIGNISSSIEGATALSKESDALVYRAAQSLVGKVGADGKIIGDMGGKGGYAERMRLMEGGVTPDMFKAIFKEIQSTAGGGEANQTELIRAAFGVNYNQAHELYRLNADGNITSSKIKGAMDTKSDFQNLMSAEEKTAQAIRELGQGAMLTKLVALDGIKFAVEGMASVFGVNGGEAYGLVKSAGIDALDGAGARLAPFIKGMTNDQQSRFIEALSGLSGYGPGSAELLSSTRIDERLARAITSGDKDAVQRIKREIATYATPGSAKQYGVGQEVEPFSATPAIMAREGLDSKTFSLLSAKNISNIKALEWAGGDGEAHKLTYEQMVQALKDNTLALVEYTKKYTGHYEGSTWVPGIPYK